MPNQSHQSSIKHTFETASSPVTCNDFALKPQTGKK